MDLTYRYLQYRQPTLITRLYHRLQQPQRNDVANIFMAMTSQTVKTVTIFMDAFIDTNDIAREK